MILLGNTYVILNPLHYYILTYHWKSVWNGLAMTEQDILCGTHGLILLVRAHLDFNG